MSIFASQRYRKLRRNQKLRKHESHIYQQTTSHRRYIPKDLPVCAFINEHNNNERLRIQRRILKGDLRLLMDMFKESCPKEIFTNAAKEFLRRRLSTSTGKDRLEFIMESLLCLHSYCVLERGLDFKKLSLEALQTLWEVRSASQRRTSIQRQANKEHRDNFTTSRMLRKAENDARLRKNTLASRMELRDVNA